MQIVIKGESDLMRYLDGIKNTKVPNILSAAFNNTLFAMREVSAEHTGKVFDRPTPFIQRASRVIKSTPSALSATLHIDQSRALILKTHEYGGERGFQRLEKYLYENGWLLDGEKAVPTGYMPRDRYGNPQQSQVSIILKGLGGEFTKSSAYFAIPTAKAVGRLRAGIYKRDTGKKNKGRILRLYDFISHPQYDDTFVWEESMTKAIEKKLPDVVEAIAQVFNNR